MLNTLVVCEPSMKSNITVKVDAELVGQAKLPAVRRGTSVGRLIADQLEQSALFGLHLYFAA